jgi:hypothetical protein
VKDRLIPAPLGVPYKYDLWVRFWKHPIIWLKHHPKKMPRGLVPMPPPPIVLVSPLGYTVTVNTISRALLYMRHGWRLTK